MSIPILNQETMANSITMTGAIAAARQALSIYSSGNCTIPLRTGLNFRNTAGSPADAGLYPVGPGSGGQTGLEFFSRTMPAGGASENL